MDDDLRTRRTALVGVLSERDVARSLGEGDDPADTQTSSGARRVTVSWPVRVDRRGLAADRRAGRR